MKPELSTSTLYFWKYISRLRRCIHIALRFNINTFTIYAGWFLLPHIALPAEFSPTANRTLSAWHHLVGAWPQTHVCGVYFWIMLSFWATIFGLDFLAFSNINVFPLILLVGNRWSDLGHNLHCSLNRLGMAQQGRKIHRRVNCGIQLLITKLGENAWPMHFNIGPLDNVSPLSGVSHQLRYGKPKSSSFQSFLCRWYSGDSSSSLTKCSYPTLDHFCARTQALPSPKVQDQRNKNYCSEWTLPQYLSSQLASISPTAWAWKNALVLR